jgi:hypothetical protein
MEHMGEPQAHKALFAVYRKNRNISIHVDLQLKLLDSLVSPILLYASEVWGFENKESIEKVHLQWGSPMLKALILPDFLLTKNDNFSRSCIHCKFP